MPFLASASQATGLREPSLLFKTQGCCFPSRHLYSVFSFCMLSPHPGHLCAHCHRLRLCLYLCMCFGTSQDRLQSINTPSSIFSASCLSFQFDLKLMMLTAASEFMETHSLSFCTKLSKGFLHSPARALSCIFCHPLHPPWNHFLSPCRIQQTPLTGPDKETNEMGHVAMLMRNQKSDVLKKSHSDKELSTILFQRQWRHLQGS